MKKVEKMALEIIYDYLEKNHFAWITIEDFIKTKEETKKYLLYLKKFCQGLYLAQDSETIYKDSLKKLVNAKLIDELIKIEEQFPVAEKIIAEKDWKNSYVRKDISNYNMIYFGFKQDSSNIIIKLQYVKEALQAMIQDYEDIC